MDRARKNQDSYDRVADQYLEGSRDRSLLRRWMQRFKKQLQSSGPVLDLGAGACFDSAELRSLGLGVISVDRSWGMLTAAREELPGPRVQADIRQLPVPPDCVAGVWACASLLHLGRDELLPAVSGIRTVLVSKGALFVSLKYGSGEGWDTARYGPDAPRWFTYWSEDDLDTVLRSAGFEILHSATDVGPHNRWIARIARRSEAV
jgi:SAM-dependent methyltransferase